MENQSKLKELLNQFKNEIKNGTCDLKSYEDVSKWLEIFIEQNPDEKAMAKIMGLFGKYNVHCEHWLNFKFDCFEALPESQKGVIMKLYENVFSKRLLNSLKYLYIYQKSLPHLLSKMELFTLVEMWFNTNIPNARIDSDELVTNMCDFINDVYNLERSEFEKMYSNYAEDNLAA